MQRDGRLASVLQIWTLCTLSIVLLRLSWSATRHASLAATPAVVLAYAVSICNGAVSVRPIVSAKHCRMHAVDIPVCGVHVNVIALTLPRLELAPSAGAQQSLRDSRQVNEPVPLLVQIKLLGMLLLLLGCWHCLPHAGWDCEIISLKLEGLMWGGGLDDRMQYFTAARGLLFSCSDG